MRLQKYMADAGIASRRKCEEIIKEGRVTVNGETAGLGRAVERGDEVRVDGHAVKPLRDNVYIMLNKPGDCVSTCSDDKGRKTVLDYLPDNLPRVYPVGRLDFNTEGLLLLTNDGDFANKLTHPKHRVQKKYLVVIDSGMSDLDIRRLESGVTIDGHKTAPAVFRVLKESPERTELLCIISEGRNRQLRKMFEVIGKKVVYIKRVAVGNLRLGDLKRGHYRYLTSQEIDGLNRISGV